MFSFAGFSSIIPYIGYLSIMWVCILIGVGGHVNKLLVIFKGQTEVAETSVIENKNQETANLLKITISKEKIQREIYAAGLFSSYPPEKDISLQKIFYPVGFLSEGFISSKGLRAPPSIS